MIFPLGAPAQEAPPTYKGSVRLPLELQTRQGQRLEKGKVDLEVRLEQKAWLLFSQGEQALARVEGRVLEGEAQDLPGAVPLVGTIFLQSSAVPLRSDFDRRYSQTGKPQYREESYDWRGTLQGAPLRRVRRTGRSTSSFTNAARTKNTGAFSSPCLRGGSKE